MEVNDSVVGEDSDPPRVEKTNKNDFEGKTLEKFTMEAFQILVEAIKCANKLPFGKNRNLYESSPCFHRILKSQENEVLSNLSATMKSVNCKGNIQRKDDDDKFEMIVDVNDTILEKVGISLDKLSGINKNPVLNLVAKKMESSDSSWNKLNGEMISNNTSTQVMNYIFNKTKNLEKPQLKFDDKINNDPKIPFEPRIKYKYNLLKPLAILPEMDENGECQNSHPYEFELLKFKPLETQMKFQQPKLYKPLDETPLRFITAKEEVSSMVEDLEKYEEISVDLEHHSYRSFQGFTCLMQISTRDTDYIIDTLELRSDLQELNKVFTNPAIVKVFHGADLDVLWLQRDLSLYVVNMFDTHQAAKLLNYPNLSLAYLLHHYCKVLAQKHFQLADWRIRPLPQELISYARQDTHYLLYIYDHLKNSLIEKGNGQKNLLEFVILESSRICSKTYKKPLFQKDGYLDIYHKSKKLFDNRQKFALEKLFEWRDATARELDESLAYVLPNHMMLNISEILPREAQGILACCNPVPLPVRKNLLHLHQIILKAREELLVKPVLEEQRFFRYSAKNAFLDNPLHCPHDLNHEEEFRDDLPVLLKNDSTQNIDSISLFHSNRTKCIYQYKIHSIPIVSVFETVVKPSAADKLQSITEKANSSSPYSRYELAKKFSESVEAQNLVALCKNKAEKKADESEKKIEIKKAKEERKIESSTSENSKLDVKSGSESKTNVEPDAKKESKKRPSMEEVDAPSKKIKRESSLHPNPFHHSNLGLRNSEEVEKNQKIQSKRRKRQKKKEEKQFVPYKYESVNFDQYKNSNAIARKKKNQKIIRPRLRGGRRNLKISI